MRSPTVSNIKRHNGLAGQISYSARVDYGADAGGVRNVAFVSSAYGGPVFMVDDSFGQTRVTDPSRFGPFGPEWVRRYFA